ncbi:hypothetical protein FA95DRAFT_125682 [Auriscalpium vulgare]|uniref:Uncharacterized protein n=1 Tax=Auriscalpium vulgare TaxID=40419 RepID=A0ACB8RN81_9AGAM|nr:hypothetical protein FA95DRAFT_125682 [Auriscalpium vulgare]
MERGESGSILAIVLQDLLDPRPPSSDLDRLANASAPAVHLPHDPLIIVFSSLVAEELHNRRDVPEMHLIPCSMPWMRGRHATPNSAALWHSRCPSGGHMKCRRGSRSPFPFIPCPTRRLHGCSSQPQSGVQDINLIYFDGSQMDLIELSSTPHSPRSS